MPIGIFRPGVFVSSVSVAVCLDTNPSRPVVICCQACALAVAMTGQDPAYLPFGWPVATDLADELGWVRKMVASEAPRRSAIIAATTSASSLPRSRGG